MCSGLLTQRPVVLLPAVSLLVLAFALAGCAADDQIAPPQRRLSEPPEMDQLVSRVLSQAAGWKTLTARCDVIVRSNRIRARGGQVDLRRGKLYMEKPGKINLTVPAKGQHRVRLVGDGKRYLVDMPVFGVRFTGRYGDPLPKEGTSVAVAPDDLVDAFDPVYVLLGKVQVPRQQGVTLCVDSLRTVREPEPKVLPGYTLMFSWQEAKLIAMWKYRADGSIRVETRFARREPFENQDGEGVVVPTRLWLGYLQGPTALVLRLRDVKLDDELETGLFEVGR
ncbi:MAG: hypothetical protein R6V05_14440 [Candidatus Brocadiia bacterium]